MKARDVAVAADSPAAAIFELFPAEMAQHIAKAKAPRMASYALGDMGFTSLFPISCFLGRRVGYLVRLLR